LDICYERKSSHFGVKGKPAARGLETIYMDSRLKEKEETVADLYVMIAALKKSVDKIRLGLDLPPTHSWIGLA